MNYFELKKGETLFREGEKGDYVCFIVKGQLEVLKRSHELQVDVAYLSRP